MKRILLFAVMMISLLANAQTTDTPSSVETIFKQMFPNARDVEWYSNAGRYEAQFYINDDWQIALFDTDANWLETLKIIEEENLPAKVIETVKAEYPEGELYNFYYVEQNDKISCYQLVVYVNYSSYLIRVDETGKILKAEKQGVMEEEVEN